MGVTLGWFTGVTVGDSEAGSAVRVVVGIETGRGVWVAVETGRVVADGVAGGGVGGCGVNVGEADGVGGTVGLAVGGKVGVAVCTADRDRGRAGVRVGRTRAGLVTLGRLVGEGVAVGGTVIARTRGLGDGVGMAVLVGRGVRVGGCRVGDGVSDAVGVIVGATDVTMNAGTGCGVTGGPGSRRPIRPSM